MAPARNDRGVCLQAPGRYRGICDLEPWRVLPLALETPQFVATAMRPVIDGVSRLNWSPGLKHSE